MVKSISFILLLIFLTSSNLWATSTASTKKSTSRKQRSKQKRKPRKFIKKNKRKKRRVRPQKSSQNRRKTNDNIADEAQAYFSKKFISFSEAIDSFFGDERTDDTPNRSTLRVSTTTTKYEGEEPFNEGNLQMNLVLSRTQKKWQLIVQGQGQDANNQNANNNITADDDDATTSEKIRDATSAGLRFLSDTAGIKVSSDVGLRVGLPPLVFARLRLNKDIPLNDLWTLRPREEVLWLQNTGFRSTTNIDFDRPLSPNLLLRLVNRINWNDQDYVIQYTDGPSLFQKIDAKRGLSYHAHVITLDTPILAVENYRLRMTYRQLLYKNWFFGSLSPQLEFPREENFHRTPSLSLKFEVLMGNL